MVDAPERLASVSAASSDTGAVDPPASGADASAADDEVTVPPAPPGVRVRWLDPAAPWAAQVGARAEGRRLEAAVAARVNLRFDDAGAGIDHQEIWECIFHPLEERPDPAAARPVDYDERDLRPEAPPGARYVLPRGAIDKAAYFRDLEKQLRDYLYRTRTTEVLVNPALKLFSRVGESRDEFAARCRAAATERAEQEAAALHGRYQQRLERLRGQQRTAEDRVRELSVDTRTRVQQEMIAGAGQLLSVFLGGRARLGSLTGAASRRSVTRRTQERLDTAKGKAEDVAEGIAELEAELADELAGIEARWRDQAGALETKTIPLEQNDVRVEEVVLLWLPT